MLGAEGHAVSAGWLTSVFRGSVEASGATSANEPQRGQAQTQTGAAAADSSATTSVASPVAPLDAAGRVALLDRAVADLSEVTAEAKRAGNLDALTKAQRLVNACLSLAAKIEPPEPPDPNQMPDMVAAAKRARARLHALLERVRAT